MEVVLVKRFQYFASLAMLVGLVFLSVGSAKPASIAEALGTSDPVIAAAGDIACDPTSRGFNRGRGSFASCRQKYTADLLAKQKLAAVLALGDNQYYCGGYQAFMDAYDLSWGKVKAITHPVVGNHEYLTANGMDCNSANEDAAGYFRYFGSAAGDPTKGYYSFDLGAWHLIALNSNCGDIGGCGPTSPEGQWLEEDLSTHSNLCTLAYWHIPLFSSGGRASANTLTMWQSLYNHDVEIVLNGHDHIYERFAPQTPDAKLDSIRGIREFIVGSGGSNHSPLETIAPNSEVRNADTYGVLMVTLHSSSYYWRFVPEDGEKFTDSGAGVCHDPPRFMTP